MPAPADGVKMVAADERTIAVEMHANLPARAASRADGARVREGREHRGGDHCGSIDRSGVKHLIDAGTDLHTATAFSGHRTASMLRRYHIDVDDLRRAAERA